MIKYIAFVERKLKDNETLNEYYQDSTLGTLEAANVHQGLKKARKMFPAPEKGFIDIVSVSRASDLRKKHVKEE